jgi:hypothetical protein
MFYSPELCNIKLIINQLHILTVTIQNKFKLVFILSFFFSFYIYNCAKNIIKYILSNVHAIQIMTNDICFSIKN